MALKTKNYATRMYPRYGGLLQSQPLTDAEKEYDEVSQAIDYAQEKLLEFSPASFTAGEFIWLNWFVNKVFMFPKQDQLDRHLVDIGELLKKVQARATESREK